MKNLRKNENGSTILWTMLISMVLLVIVAATLSISYAYSRRSLNGNDQKQAYFTARSAVNMVVNEFSSNSPDAQVIFTYLMDSRSWHTDDVGFSKSQMGTCALDISLSKNTIIEIKATAHKNGKTSVVGATLVGIPLPTDENPENMPSDSDNSGDGTTENSDVTPVPDSNAIDPARMEWHVKSYFKDAAYEGVGS